MVRPRGARGFGRRWLIGSCVNVFGLRLEHVLLAIMDISAHAILLPDRPRRAIWVTRVRTRREDRSSIVVSSSRRTRRGRGWYVIDSLLALRRFFFRAWGPFLPPGPRVQRCAARRDRQGWPSRLALPFAPAWPGLALTGPSTARGLSGLGRSFIGLDAREGVPLVENRPGDAGELVGERDRQHVVV